MSDGAAAARREYKRKWYAKNKQKQRAYTEKYWEKKAAESANPNNATLAERGEQGSVAR